MRSGYAITILAAVVSVSASAAPLALNDKPGGPGEWGFRPSGGKVSPTNPPSFSWRPQKHVASYELQCSRDRDFAEADYHTKGIRYNVHCPPRTFKAGEWFWRVRFVDGKGIGSKWSKTRSFTVDAQAVEFPMPSREELLGRIPNAHPRLFVRPEQIGHLRELARGELNDTYRAMRNRCDNLIEKPPATQEPRKYPEGMTRGSDPWRKIWWGNRNRTKKVLRSASTLGFVYLLSGEKRYGRLAVKLLMGAAEWDPKGSTGYRYNDEAGMPYAYYFARTYTFINDLLSEKQKRKCREVMTVRGREMYNHLNRRHLWRPYGSHRNRAWHFLGEAGIAFMGEIPDAEEWVWFAMNVFYNVYPVWCDTDGGWHEGAGYWSSYMTRFTWWADAMRVAMGVDAYKKPFFSKAGYFAMYLQPPGTVGGGFGDLNARRTSARNREIMTVFAAQAGNPYWQWYVNRIGGPHKGKDYIGFIRGALPSVKPKPPIDLPTSRCFHGTGLAFLNTDSRSAKNNVSVLFKSSPFGTQSHGYESNNSFLLYAYGERLLIRTGRRDSYGSNHHRHWMWQTKSTNCVTVNGAGQEGHSRSATGRITGFHTSDAFDFVAGEAGGAYRQPLKRFTRSILFVKPGLVILYDRLIAREASTFQWLLHSPVKMTVKGQRDIRVERKKAACRASLLAPEGLKCSVTNKFDPPPRPRIKLVEWHLTAGTAKPQKQMEFIALIRPHRAGDTPPEGAELEKIKGGYALEADISGGRVLVLMRARGTEPLICDDYSTRADMAAMRFDTGGEITAKWEQASSDK